MIRSIFKRGLRQALFCAFAAAPAAALAQAANVQAELDALIKAAKAEGEVTIYSSATENIIKRTGDAFAAKYGVKYTFIRMSGTLNIQRYSTEAESGVFAADFLFNAGAAQSFARESIKKGWVEPISEAGLPAVKSGQFPAKFVSGPTALIQIAPWSIMYNTALVRPADVPKDWTGLIDPKFKGKVLIPDPRSTDAHLDLWSLILDKYGEGFFTKLREMQPRQYGNAVQAANGIAAGEGLLHTPAVGQTMQSLKDKGAPVAIVTPDHTVGVEMQAILTHRSKAKHPNAARLFVNFVMTPEGNKIFNADPGSVSVYDTAALPKQYEPTKPETVLRKELITRLLGFQ